MSIALALACAKKDTAPAQPKTPPPLPADVAPVASAVNATATTDTAAAPNAGVATEAGGTIVATGEFVSPVRSELAAKLPGRVAKMYVDEGSQIAKGQPLLELETDYTRINLQRADADAQRAAAAEADAERDLSRKKELIAKDSIPRATYDRSASAFDQAKAAHASAVAQAVMYKQQLTDSTLRSPIDGVVAEKRTDVGQRLQDNTVALVVVQTSPLKLRFRIPEKYLATVHRGEEVKATVDPYPGQVFAGRVTVVGGVIDPATRSFTVETEFPNRDGKLRPGLFARVEMEPH
ncbi:MAG TPA: efflux RND transporter periplasmic adaptor subunit [Thermoanaerobaculia bacterium]|nr:efflux RND transporter periplasmic adaptor subunit [Thermoanaerobaculia bacterium]